MFTKLNTRITRTLLAAVIPAAMSLGFTSSTLASTNSPAVGHVNHCQSSSSLVFTGTSEGSTVIFQMFYVSPKSINGTITINDTQYPFVACVEGNNIRGILDDNGTQVRFDGLGQADQLYLQLGSRTVTLQMIN